MIPPPVFCEHEGFKVIRDDLLPGGSKRRALIRWLPELQTKHFNYVGTVFGSGAWALAEACHDLNLSCTLHFSKNKFQPLWLTRLADLPCEIIWHEPKPVQHIYEALEEVLPLGFDDPKFIENMADIFDETIINPKQIWLPCVGGTLVKAAQKAWPDSDIQVVCTAKAAPEISDVHYHYAPEKYHQNARIPPSYPACIFSDGKVWQFAREFALKNALIWNVSQ